MGPRETEVKATVSEKSGNVRTTLTMGFPYCNPCAKRASIEKFRKGAVIGLACVFGAGLAFGAFAVDLGIGLLIQMIVIVPVAALIAFGLAIGTRPALPAPPATARGEAVILKNTSGTVHCTNEQFAQLLAQANGRQARPSTLWMTTEVWAPLAALLCGAVLVMAFAGDAQKKDARRADSARAPAQQAGVNGSPDNATQPAKKPTPAPPRAPASPPKGH